MQDITTKLSRIAAAVKAAGLTEKQARHLIHGTGGSPRRARRAIRLGIHEQLIAAYSAALDETGSHIKALVACNALWAELVPSAPAEPDADDEADEQPEPAVAIAPVRRRRSAPDTAKLRELAQA